MEIKKGKENKEELSHVRFTYFWLELNWNNLITKL